ncbi:MAG: bifunctional oligoribonuclease/PAP phosphatase NrnA [Bacteroidetes bacterium]|nr:bifunctional oligoribonuclease/PAP phosphatase NrnA [Bacteroidota bacterium]MBK9048230.1 bifunctional oligoribonuclease/PAP phosphatase NrnA [Bacteroidota bacterium]MBK9425340.1 bifunctional oligoribonuclease/PAP phosphatase NrnA [Bacteroidota bacterium]
MIPSFNSDSINALRLLLSEPRKIVITTHHKPDGDAMGSSLALYHFLLTGNHQVQVVTPSDYPDFLYWLPGHSKVIDFDHAGGQAKQVAEAADIIFCLDFNAPGRMEKFSDAVMQSKATKVLIDHHLDPEHFCDYEFSFPKSCATCELMYYFICELGGKQAFTKEIATCLYTGIMTDTGSFRFASMTADTHMVIAALMQAGAENFTIHEQIYDNFSLERTRFLGHCIKDKLVVLPQYKTAYISVTKEELKAFNHQSGDTEGIVNYALGIKGIRMAVFFCERDHLIKISFRSKDNFSVKELAAAHFSGGGHRNAAGGRSTESLEATISRFLALLPDLKQELNPETTNL